MTFNPLTATEVIDATYRDYSACSFRIKDAEFQKLYKEEVAKNTFSKGPYLEVIDAFATGCSLKSLIEENVISSSFEKLFCKQKDLLTRPLYKHQEDALRHIIKDNNAIVTTGTGSGKTECFLYPIVNYLMREEERGELNHGIRALFLYPMNALANDQLKRLRELLKDYPEITFGSYTGETEEKKEIAEKKYISTYGSIPLTNEILDRETMRKNPPHIFITNYAMLEYLMIRPEDNTFFDGDYSSSWKYIVLDEAHTYSGASGMEVSMLMRRLYYKLKKREKIRFILTSATLGDKSNDEKIVTFAHNLCAEEPFSYCDIIRATRSSYPRPPQIRKTNYDQINQLTTLLEKYRDPETSEKNKLDAKNKILESIGKANNENLNEALYDYLAEEKLYHDLRDALKVEPRTVRELIDELSLDKDVLIDFVELCSFANKNHAKLLDARYHHFMKTMEGAYVTFKPQKTLTLTPRNEALFPDGNTYKCFKLSVCQSCGSEYLTGYIEGNVFNQDTRKKNRFFYDYR